MKLIKPHSTTTTNCVSGKTDTFQNVDIQFAVTRSKTLTVVLAVLHKAGHKDVPRPQPAMLVYIKSSNTAEPQQDSKMISQNKTTWEYMTHSHF